MMATGTTRDNVNLRTGPNTTSRILRVVSKGTTVTVLEQAGDWFKVQTPDAVVGYLNGQYLAIQPDVPAQPAPQPSAPTDSTTFPKLTIPGDSLNVRSSPMISNNPDNRVEALTGGAILTPLEDPAGKLGTSSQQNQWIQVRTPSGKEGYVAAWLVTLAQTTTTTQPASSGSASAPAGRVDGRTLQPDLHAYIDTIPAGDYLLPQGYYDFWRNRYKLGLPDPFDISPTQLGANTLRGMSVNGFGPNSFAAANWPSFYKNVAGMHNGLDHIVTTGTPLVALSDGVIIGDQNVWRFIGVPTDKTLALWCFLPDQFRDSQGRRMLSNVIVAYAHTSNNTVVARRAVVKAGQTIAISGNPAGQSGNDHLHLEIHLLTGDPSLPKPSSRRLNPDYKGSQPFDNYSPFNPLLFFTERLVRYHMHQGKKLGFGSRTTYPDQARIAQMGLNWPPLDFFTIAQYQYGTTIIWNVNPPWPSGIYDLPALIQRINNYTDFQPYEANFLG